MKKIIIAISQLLKTFQNLEYIQTMSLGHSRLFFFAFYKKYDIKKNINVISSHTLMGSSFLRNNIYLFKVAGKLIINTKDM